MLVFDNNSWQIIKGDVKMHFDVELPQDFKTELKNSVIKTLSDSIGSIGNTSNYPEFMDKVTASDFLGISRSTLDKWIRDYGLPYSLIGGSYRFSKTELKRFMSKQVK